MAKKKKINTNYLLLGVVVIGGLLILNDRQQKNEYKSWCKEFNRANEEQGKRYYLEDAESWGDEINEDWEENSRYKNLYKDQSIDCG